MFWVWIIGDKLCEPFWVPEEVKLTSNSYTAFLGEQLSQCLKNISLSLRFKVVFMHDNVPSYAAMTPTSFLKYQAFFGQIFITWPHCSPDLNLIEHLWTILKRGVYEGGEQFTSKFALWSKIVDVVRVITSCQIKPLISSVDKRLFKLISKNRKYVDKYIIYMRLSLQDVPCVYFL